MHAHVHTHAHEFRCRDDIIHFCVNHSLYFKDPTTAKHTNGVEGTHGAFKRKERSQFGTSMAGYDGSIPDDEWDYAECRKVCGALMRACT